MTRRRSLLLFVVLALSLTGVTRNGVRAVAPSLPDKLSDRDYWSLVTEFSEPDGEFRSDNLLSNEIFLQAVIPDLIRGAKPSRVYLGVGPEQNFTYIAALKPKMAFIVDVRRGNLQLHLMYKALFELSSDRADFIFRLFSRKRPDGLDSRSTADEIFSALYKAEPQKGEAADLLYRQNLKSVQDHLTRVRHLPLSAEDLKGIEYVYGSSPGTVPGSPTGRREGVAAAATRRPTGISWWLTTAKGSTGAFSPTTRTSRC